MMGRFLPEGGHADESSYPSDILAARRLQRAGGYYLLTGLWPLVHIRSFKWVTDKKTDNLPSGLDIDHWLVVTVGVLVLAIGLALTTAAIRKTHTLELAILAMGASVGLTAVDVVYVVREMILPIYLVDAVAQVILLVGWTIGLLRMQAQSEAS